VIAVEERPFMAASNHFLSKASFSSKQACIIDRIGGPVPEIRALFWDVGGVLLTNAWDHEERNLAIDAFHLDKDEFEKRSAV